MEQVSIGDLDQLLLGHKVGDIKTDPLERERLSGRGYLFVSDDETMRDSAISRLRKIIAVRYLDFNAEPQGKKISEMCLNAFGTSYHSQKEYGFDISTLARKNFEGIGLIVDNFQDIGLLAARDVKLSLAFLRSLGRHPYDIPVIGIGSKESLDLIKQDAQLKYNWEEYALVKD